MTIGTCPPIFQKSSMRNLLKLTWGIFTGLKIKMNFQTHNSIKIIILYTRVSKKKKNFITFIVNIYIYIRLYFTYMYNNTESFISNKLF